MGNFECNKNYSETNSFPKDFLERQRSEVKQECISSREKLLAELFNDGKNEIKSLTDIDNLMSKYNFSLSEEDKASIEVGDALFVKVVDGEIFLTLEKKNNTGKSYGDFKVLTAITQNQVTQEQSQENSYSKMKLEEFLALPKEKRLEIITKPINNGYLKLNFPNQEIEKGIKLQDILPDNFNTCEILRSENPKSSGRKTKFGVSQISSSNYYDLVGKDLSGEYVSAFSGKNYEKGFDIKSGYIIKPFSSDFKEMSTIFSTNPQEQQVYNPSAQNNEKVIRNLFGELISKSIKEIKSVRPDSILDENFIYAIIAQESKFDPNAVSGGNAMGLGQIVRSTGLPEVLLKNYSRDNKDPDSVFLTGLLDVGDNFKVEKKGGKYDISGVGTKLFDPTTSIKLIISYLFIVEGYFKNIKDPEYKRKLIACGYNAGPGGVLEAIKSDTTPKNWDWVTKRLKIALGRQKANEASKYARKVDAYYGIAQSKQSQQLALNN